MNVEEIISNIYLVKIPVPIPLKYVNCYLGECNHKWQIIDTAIPDSCCRKEWLDVIKELNLTTKNVSDIYITHFHPDHIGLASFLHEQTGAEVNMVQEEYEFAQYHWKSPNRIDEIARFLVASGVPPYILEGIIDKIKDMRGKIVLPKKVKYLKAGQMLNIGGHAFKTLITPGHTNSHTCFYALEEKALLAGDHILPVTTTNISYLPAYAHNPLKDYFQSLGILDRLPLGMILPAHGDPFAAGKKRIQELFRHHLERLKAIDKACGGRNLFQVAEEIFGHNLSSYEWFFAVGEIAAHVKYLQARFIDN